MWRRSLLEHGESVAHLDLPPKDVAKMGFLRSTSQGVDTEAVRAVHEFARRAERRGVRVVMMFPSVPQPHFVCGAKRSRSSTAGCARTARRRLDLARFVDSKPAKDRPFLSPPVGDCPPSRWHPVAPVGRCAPQAGNGGREDTPYAARPEDAQKTPSATVFRTARRPLCEKSHFRCSRAGAARMRHPARRCCRSRRPVFLVQVSASPHGVAPGFGFSAPRRRGGEDHCATR